MQDLLYIDHQLFRLINSQWTTAFLDQLFPLITDLHKSKFFFKLAIPALLALIIWKKKLEGVWIFFSGLLTLGLADFIGGKLIKPFFARPRPPLVLEDVILRAPHFGGYSFTSNHASNLFCAAAFFAFYFPKARLPLFALAWFVAYSRVYCGVHFPSDVLGAALWGSLLGLVSAQLFFHIYAHFFQKKRVI